MFNKRPDNSSIGTVKKNSNPDTMTNAEILQAIEIMMDEASEGGSGRRLYCWLISSSRGLQTLLRINLTAPPDQATGAWLVVR